MNDSSLSLNIVAIPCIFLVSAKLSRSLRRGSVIRNRSQIKTNEMLLIIPVADPS